MKSRITGNQILGGLTAIGTVIALLLIGWSMVSGVADNPATAKGTTNFSDLVVDSIVIDGIYPMLTDNASQAIYANSGIITGTLAVTAGTHGLTTINSAYCTLAESPGTEAGAGALCWVDVSGTTVTITVEQDDWTTNATVGIDVYYMIVGTP